MSKKLHWFPFYYLDWLSDSELVMMTYSEKGLFIDMLSRCYNEDGLSANEDKLLRLFKCDKKDLEECMKMFYKKGEKLFNKKLDTIKKDQAKISLSRSSAGKASAQARKDKRLMESTSVEQVLECVATKAQQNSTNTVQYNREENNKEKKNQKNIEKLKDELVIFDEFRKLYGGKKNGNETEFSKFIKVTSDWRNVLPDLKAIVETQINIRNMKKANNVFCPEWKNLSTWINNRCWEEEESSQLDNNTLTLKQKVDERRRQQ